MDLEPDGVETIRRALEGDPESRHPDRPAGTSAVLMTLVPTDEGPGLLYTRRADKMRHHAGEVSFPGGRIDPTDAHPLAAALREAEEEVGLAPTDVDVLGHLTDFMTYRGVLVCAYVAALRAGRKAPVEPRSVDEVSHVFPVPIARLVDDTIYEARRIEGMPQGARVHYWHVPPQTVWGITGELTARYLRRAHAWQPPPRVRTIRELTDFQPA